MKTNPLGVKYPDHIGAHYFRVHILNIHDVCVTCLRSQSHEVHIVHDVTKLLR